MDLFYQTYIAREDQIYQSMPRRKPISGQVDPPELEFGVDWLCHGAHSVLDFGCGNGSLLFACAYRGVERLVGIDLSREAVALARWAGEDLPQCQFLWGSVEKLMELPDTSFDGIVLSNILDNLKPTDSRAVLQETIRLLQPEGKVLIKLNPYLTREQIEAWGVRTIEGDLLDDGLLLWNRTTEAWQEELQRDFRTVRFEDVYFSEYDQHDRMFLCEALQNANK